MVNVDTVIVGGGISGTSLLHFLARSGHDVLLIEESERLGGVIRSEHHPTMGVIERGPNTLQSSSGSLADLIADLGLEGNVVEASASARNRFVLRNGRMIAVPTNPRQAVETPLISAMGKLRILTEFVRPRRNRPDESVAEFVRRRFGGEALSYVFDPLMSGIYAGDPDQLAVAEVFGVLVQLEQEHGSILKGLLNRSRRRRKAGEARERRSLFSFQDGLSTLCDAVHERWPERVMTGHSVEHVERMDGRWSVRASGGEGPQQVTADRVVFALNAPRTAALIEHLDSEAASLLRHIEYAPIAVVSLMWPVERIHGRTDGFGVLVPSAEGRDVLGVIFSSSIFPNRGPGGQFVCTAFVGGARRPELVKPGREKLGDLVQKEVASIVAAKGPADAVEVMRWMPGIAQNTRGHAALVNRIEARLDSVGGVYLTGSYLSGVSIPNCIDTSHAVAESIFDQTEHRTHENTV